MAAFAKLDRHCNLDYLEEVKIVIELLKPSSSVALHQEI
jgi:hypothetical protein